jgi:hypothetical protein
MGRARDLAARAGATVSAAATGLSEAISGLSLVGISAAVLAAVALVGVTTDGLPVVVRNQPFAFSSAVAVCVFIVAVSTVANVRGNSFTQWVVRIAGVLLAGALASTVYMAAWGATEATAARITVAFSGSAPDLRYDATVTATLLPSDDMLTVFAATGSRKKLASSCGKLMEQLADQQPRRGLWVDRRQVWTADGSESVRFDGRWVTVARVGPDAEGTATWSGIGAVTEGADALCIKAVVPARCALGLTTDEGLCRIGSEAKEAFWLVDLDTAAGAAEEDG